jgi:hypothetical protein
MRIDDALGLRHDFSFLSLFSRLDGLSARGRIAFGAKIEALQPFPTRLTSSRLF